MEAFRDRTLDIRNELLARYLADHHDHWTAFLGAVDLVPPSRLAETHSRLRGLAPRTSALFRFLERTGRASNSAIAAVRAPRPKPPIPKPLTEDEALDVLDAAADRFGSRFVSGAERARVWVNGDPVPPPVW